MGTKKVAYINCEMLLWARSNTPFETTTDVEKQTKIKAEKIDIWEKGDDYPSITEAKKLAKLYKVPFAAFYLSEVPEKSPRPYTDRRTYNNTVYRETSYSLWAEIERVVGNRDCIMQYVKEFSFIR